MSKWEQHVKCTQIIRRHPDWTDEQVLTEVGMRPLEIDIVTEARREVSTAEQPGQVRSERSF